MNKLCECGCGKEVINPNNIYIFNHHPKNKDRKLSDEWKRKISIANKGKIISEEQKKAISIANTGKIFSEEHKHKISKRIISDKTKQKLSIANIGKKRSYETKLKMSLAQKGRHHSEESKLKISNSNKGIKPTEYTIQQSIKAHKGTTHSLETRLKISSSSKRRIGWKHTIESKHKMSISTVKYLNENNYSPRRGRNENQIIDQLEKTLGIEILRNNLELALISGKYNDGFITKYNLGIDILESHHFKPTSELSDYDQERELIIASNLACIIYYIPEQEFLNNPNKEIERFKNFIELLRN